jgi:Zn-dependent alcohol dehydrogenase
MKHVQIIGTVGASIDHYHRALLLMEHNAHRFSWDDMISNTYPLERINEAMERMARFEEVKPAILF